MPGLWCNSREDTMKLRHRVGKWASDKSFAYYKTQTDTEGRPGSYKNLPRYLEILVNWGKEDPLLHRWVIRGREKKL